MKINSTRQMVEMALLVAIASILFFFEFPVIPGTPLQFDFSDLPVIVAGYTMGIGPGILVALLKNVIHILFISRNAGIAGEVANFLFAALIMLPIALYKPKNKLKQIAYYAFMVVVVSLAMVVLNYYITLPLYGMVVTADTWGWLLGYFTPFNLVKGGILYTVILLIKPYLDRIK